MSKDTWFGGDSGAGDGEGDERELIPEGTHDAEVKDVARGTSKSNNPQLTITFELFDEQNESMGTLKSWEPMQVDFRRTMIRKALGRPGDPALGPGATTEDWQLLVGRACRVKIKHERYDGELGAKVNKILPALDGVQDNRPSGDDVATDAEPAADADLPF